MEDKDKPQGETELVAGKLVLDLKSPYPGIKGQAEAVLSRMHIRDIFPSSSHPDNGSLAREYRATQEFADDQRQELAVLKRQQIVREFESHIPALKTFKEQEKTTGRSPNDILETRVRESVVWTQKEGVYLTQDEQDECLELFGNAMDRIRATTDISNLNGQELPSLSPDDRTFIAGMIFLNKLDATIFGQGEKIEGYNRDEFAEELDKFMEDMTWVKIAAPESTTATTPQPANPS